MSCIQPQVIEGSGTTGHHDIGKQADAWVKKYNSTGREDKGASGLSPAIRR